MRQSSGKITRSQFLNVKNGIKQIVHQGFSRLKGHHEALSVGITSVHETLEASEYDLRLAIAEGRKTSVHETLEASEYDLRLAIAEGRKECFFSQVLLPSAPGVFFEDASTDTEQVQRQAEKRTFYYNHHVSPDRL